MSNAKLEAEGKSTRRLVWWAQVAYNASAQNLIVSPTAMNILEGGVGVFTVRLATQPAANVSVTVSPTERDDDQRYQWIDLVDSRRYRGF